MLTSKGMAGVPRASLVVIAATLGQFNIPEAGLLLIIGVDHFLDLGRTETNVLGNAVASVSVAKWENVLAPSSADVSVDDAGWTSHGRDSLGRRRGYPCRQKLSKWIRDRYPEARKCVISSAGRPTASSVSEQAATYELCTREASGQAVARKLDDGRVPLCKWRNWVARPRGSASMKRDTGVDVHAERPRQAALDLRLVDAPSSILASTRLPESTTVESCVT